MQKPRIMLVDDDVANSRLTGMHLDKTGRYDIRLENRPQNALAVAREFKPDVCIFDIDMPGMDGGELATRFKADPEFSHTPVAFLTSLVAPDEAGNSEIIRGGRSYLAKPPNIPALIRCVERLLGATTR